MPFSVNNLQHTFAAAMSMNESSCWLMAGSRQNTSHQGYAAIKNYTNKMIVIVCTNCARTKRRCDDTIQLVNYSAGTSNIRKFSVRYNLNENTYE